MSKPILCPECSTEVPNEPQDSDEGQRTICLMCPNPECPASEEGFWTPDPWYDSRTG